ncbi:MAG: molybdopterin converting factor subunit 1 [Myxococcota bacterium]|jgi:molybdopterin converting factor subunit 1
MPTVQVLYFAALRERRGRSAEQVEVPAGTTLGALYATLFPPGPQGALPVAYARNQAYAAADTPVEHGDEVCFIPPIGGG